MTMWDSFRELQTLRRDIDRAFTGAGFMSPSTWRLAFLPGRSARQYPMVNILEDGDNIFLEALMPGIDPQALDVTVLGNVLTMSGEKIGFGDMAPERIHRSERAAGRFVRTIELPAEIERDQVTAEYRTGLLLLTMPRSESSKPRRVQIQSDGAST